MNWRQGLLILLICCLGLAFARFEWRDVIQTVDILPDGRVVVTDERTLWTDEDFGEAFICVPLSGNQQLVMDTQASGSLSGHSAQAYQQNCEGGIRGQEVVIRHSRRIKEGRVRFVYTLENTLDYYSDVVQWYWNVVEREHPVILRYSLTVNAPGPMMDSEEVYTAFVHRYANLEIPTVSMTHDRSQLSVIFNRIPDGEGVEIRYFMDPLLFDQQGTEPGLEKLLEDELRVTGVMEGMLRRRELQGNPLWGTIAGAIALLLTGGIFRDYQRYGKDPDIPSMQYPFEPPSDLPPAAVAHLLTKQNANTSHAFHATIMDLARQGYGEFASEGRKFAMFLDLQKHTGELKPFEQDVLNYLKQAARTGPKREGFLGLQTRPQSAEEQAHLEFEELKSYSKSRLSSFMSSWSQKTKKWVENRLGGPLLSKESSRAQGKWAGLSVLALVLCGAGAFVTLDTARAIFIGGGVFSVVMAMVAIVMMPAWREDIASEVYGWQGFKRTLSDYTIMKDAPDDFFKLWDRYYCYAAAMGVAERFLKNLQRAAPLRGMDERSMMRQASWMGASNMSSPSFSSFSSAITSMSSSLRSVSASSGGSSSGGGGGGGGGGRSGGR